MNPSEAIWDALHRVKDPEIPVVSIVELGIVQGVEQVEDGLIISITPTFSGCPALDLMRAEIVEELQRSGHDSVEVRIVLDPPWNSDRITAEAREKMKAIGLAPPPPTKSRFESDDLLSILPAQPDKDPNTSSRTRFDTSALALPDEVESAVECPFCGSEETLLENAFGPTICRSIHYCHACQQPFERFKALG